MNRFPLLYICIVLLYISCSSDTQPIIPIEEQEEQNTYVQYGMPFPDVPAVEDIVMYEVNIRAHGPDADLQAIIQKLDYIDSLGVNVIWLMPIYPIGSINSVNSPYSIKDFKAVNPDFGSLEDLRSLTDQAHERGIAVILDWVANHTAWDHPWIENPGWYSTNSNGEIIHPPGTNWIDVADLNFDNADMRAAMIDAMLYWVYEANVDGFRCDYADGVPYGFWQTVWDTMDTIPNRDIIAFAEGARSDHFQAGFDMAFGWEFYSAIKSSFATTNTSVITQAIQSEDNWILPGKKWVRFTTNHDETAWDATPVEIFGGMDAALAASIITIFSGGVPLIYGSQEVGVDFNVPFFSVSTINWDANPDLLNSYRRILNFYAEHSTARRGEVIFFNQSDVVIIQRKWNNESIWILVNITNSNKIIDPPSEMLGQVWEDAITSEILDPTGTIELGSFSFKILK